MASRTRLTTKRSTKPKTNTRTGKRSTPAADRTLRPIGVIRSTIKTRAQAPRQGWEGGVDAWLEVTRPFAEGLDTLAAGDELLILTWLHRSDRGVLKVQRRRYDDDRIYGVFATRSPDRPNPIGLHRVILRRIAGNRLRIGPIEVIDKTPVVDIKPALEGQKEG